MHRWEIGAIVIVLLAALAAAVAGTVLTDAQRLCTSMCGTGGAKQFVAARPGIPATCECK